MANMETPLNRLVGREFRISDFEARHTKPDKPNGIKTLVINNMTQKSAKQTQRPYSTCYQLFTAILAPILMKFGSKGRVSLPGIRAKSRGLAGKCRAKARRYRGRREEFYQQTYDVL